MTTSAALIVLSLVAVSGVAVVASELLLPARSVVRTLRRLHRDDSRTGSVAARVAASRLPLIDRLLPPRPDLALAGVTPERHVLQLMTAACAGALVPAGVLVVAAISPIDGLPALLVLLLPVAGALLAPLFVHAARLERIRAERDDMRHQLSAFLDVVTMLLAANDGQESALEHAASAGDGRLFRELRRRMREAGAAGDTLVTALAATGTEFGLHELEQVAATAALSSAEGSPVARTLAAKCATLRATLASEQETEARLRTSRLTPPIVGMALIFMALVIYPALAAT